MTTSLCKVRRRRVLRAPPRRLSSHAHRVVRSNLFLSTATTDQEDQSHKLGTAPLSGMLVPVNNIMVVVRVRAWLLQLLSFASNLRRSPLLSRLFALRAAPPHATRQSATPSPRS